MGSHFESDSIGCGILSPGEVHIMYDYGLVTLVGMSKFRIESLNFR